MKRLTIRAAHDSVLTDLEIDSTERILMILLIRRFLLEHRELHIFLHAVLLTEDVVVIGSVTGICNRILRVETIDVPKSIHQRNKAVHVCTILVYVNNCYIFICNSDLDVVCRKQLVISHVVCFNPHECCCVIGLRIAVSSLSTDSYLFYILFKLRCILPKFLIMTLLHGFVMSTAIYELHFIQLPYLRVFLCCFFYVLRSILAVYAELYSCAG